MRLGLVATVSFCAVNSLFCGMAAAISTPGCEGVNPQACITRALDAMGGRAKIEGIHSLQLDVMSHTALMEQSYRQAPFITSYERDHTTIDLAAQRMRTEAHTVWPESDPHQAESDNVLIASPAGGIYQTAQGDTPCSLGDLDSTRETLALGSSRIFDSPHDSNSRYRWCYDWIRNRSLPWQHRASLPEQSRV